MLQQEQQTDAHHKKIRETNKKKHNKNTKTYSSSSSLSLHNKRSSGGFNCMWEKKDKKKKRLYNDNDECPIHGGSSHTWGHCHQNQYGDNFKPGGNQQPPLHVCFFTIKAPLQTPTRPCVVTQDKCKSIIIMQTVCLMWEGPNPSHNKTVHIIF